MIDLSIVVVNWNTCELVCACLAEIEAVLGLPREVDRERCDALDFEVWLVDNGSRDGSLAAVAESYPWVRRIELERNLGFARANNLALARARGRNLLLLNTDARITREAVERCTALLDSDPGTAIVGPQLLHGDGRRQNSVHAFPSLATEVLPLALLEWLMPGRYPSKRVPRQGPIEVEAVQGAALFARRSLVEEIGGLPEEYFFFLEETVWCWRARRAGYTVQHLPDVFVEHSSGASSKSPHPGATGIEYHRSLYRFLRDHRGPVVTRIAIVLRCVRAAVSTLLLAIRSPLSARARHRMRGRSAVLRWHLAGCPATAGLAWADARGSTRSAEGRKLQERAPAQRAVAAAIPEAAETSDSVDREEEGRQ